MKPSKIYETFEYNKGRYKLLLTKSLTPKYTPFNEDTINKNGIEYRVWDPKRSKLGAMIIKGSPDIRIRKNQKILYLGASHGYTPSFISDMIGKEGQLFALDFAPTVMRDLTLLTERRSNMCPIMADANKPEIYQFQVPLVDLVFQDISQRNQVDIFIKNCEMFLKKDHFGLLAVKANSIDVTKKPDKIYKEVKAQLEDAGFIITEQRKLDPFEKNHAMFIVKIQQ